MLRFLDRRDAGRRLADRLVFLKGRDDVIVLAIPRGGVVVGDELASSLDCPLDVFITHKIGAPSNPELAIGAVASDGTTFLDDYLIAELEIDESQVERAREEQVVEIRRRGELYRLGQPPSSIEGKTVVLTDDGIATGSTTIAALRSLENYRPAQRILAVPVAPRVAAEMLERECDQLVVLATPEPFVAVGRFYRDFDQVGDDVVIEILLEARRRRERGEQV